jgi:hypothetical protein
MRKIKIIKASIISSLCAFSVMASVPDQSTVSLRPNSGTSIPSNPPFLQLINGYADHNPLSLGPIFTLNVGQMGAFNIRGPGFTALFRSPEALNAVQKETQTGNFFATAYNAIKNEAVSEKSTTEINENIQNITHKLVTDLENLGLKIASVEFEATKIKNAAAGVISPVLFYESNEQYSDRVTAAFQEAKKTRLPIICIQEVDLSTEASLHIWKNVLAQNQDYVAAQPLELGTTTNITFYKKEMTLMGQDQVVEALKQAIQYALSFKENDRKLQINAFKQQDGKNLYVVNLHADWGAANDTIRNPYELIAHAIKSIPLDLGEEITIALCGDLNLKSENLEALTPLKILCDTGAFGTVKTPDGTTLDLIALIRLHGTDQGTVIAPTTL